MATTTIKVSIETRERIRAFGGETHEETIIAALDALEAEHFWQQAEVGRAWFDALPDDEQQRLREEDAEIDRAFSSL